MRSTVVRRLATPISTPSAATISKAPSTHPKPPLASKSASSQRSAKSRGPALSLEHFLLRSRVRTLYRTIVRAIYQIPDKDARRDPIAHAKGEFARNKHVTDTEQIRYLVSTGKAEWDGMRRYVEEMAVLGRK